MTTTTKEAKRLRDAATPGEWTVSATGLVFGPDESAVAEPIGYGRDEAELDGNALCIAKSVNNFVPLCEERDKMQARAIEAEKEAYRLEEAAESVHHTLRVLIPNGLLPENQHFFEHALKTLDDALK